MSCHRRRSFLGLLGAAAILVACSSAADPADGAAMLPDVDLTTVDDTTVSTTSLFGEPLVVNFWYSTCAPCAKELQYFAAVDDETGDAVRFVGVNPLDSAERMTEFAAERGVTYDLYRDELAELQEALGLVSFPVTVFVRSDGRIHEQTGPLDADQLRDGVERLLAADADA